MGWSDQVHANRFQTTNRKNQASSQHSISTPQPRKPNASVFPIALVAGAAASRIWWRKGGNKNFQGADPFQEIIAFVKRLFGGSGKRLTQNQSGNWKGSRPGNMAGAAAAQRAQASIASTSQQAAAPQQRGGGAGGGKKKNKKKKRSH